MNQLPNQNGEDDMSFVDLWRRAVFADATLNTTTKLVAMALTEYADWSTGRNAWPSNATIASMCSCSTKTVTRARASLSDAGLISVREKAGPGGTTICNLLMPADGMDTESTPMGTESMGYGHRVHPGGTQSPVGMDTESHNPTIELTIEPTRDQEEEVRAVRAKTRDAAATAAAPNSITRQVRTERDAERQEQQAPVESVRDADQAEGFEWEYTDYVDAIRQGHRDTGLMCHDMTHHHDRLVRLAMEEGWTPERLRQDVAANLGSYRKRNVNWHARMLVSDMGKRSAPSNLGAAMEVSHNNVVRQLGRAEVNAQRASNLWGMS